MFVINPGSGVLEDANAMNATINMHVFVNDLRMGDFRIFRKPELDYGNGRFCFIVEGCEIQMPGLPLSEVRWMDAEINIWKFPRLYVDGSSWVWKFAIDAVSRLINEGEQHER